VSRLATTITANPSGTPNTPAQIGCMPHHNSGGPVAPNSRAAPGSGWPCNTARCPCRRSCPGSRPSGWRASRTRPAPAPERMPTLPAKTRRPRRFAHRTLVGQQPALDLAHRLQLLSVYPCGIGTPVCLIASHTTGTTKAEAMMMYWATRVHCSCGLRHSLAGKAGHPTGMLGRRSGAGVRRDTANDACVTSSACPSTVGAWAV
jgi:hypothetical protein